jgi:hypothetical protein
LVASLIPLFRYEYGKEIKKFFKPDAWEMQKETYWDPELYVAVTPDDRRVEDITEQDPEYQWAEDGMAVEIKGGPRWPDPKEKSLYGDDGGDSVSTFRTGSESIREKLKVAANQGTPTAAAGMGTIVTPAPSCQQGELRSTSSITSMLDGTVESRISSLESGVEQTNRMMQDMMKMMERFTKQDVKATSEREQAMEVATTGDQDKNKSPRGKVQE